jgi:diketogulonate reductase-like aldo/keto reductase
MRENLAAAEFDLSQQDLERLAALESGRRFTWKAVDPSVIA